jgi:hypothetical protein
VDWGDDELLLDLLDAEMIDVPTGNKMARNSNMGSCRFLLVGNVRNLR